MASVLSARPNVDVITARARQARPGRMLLTVIAALLFAVGWLLAKAADGLWLCAAWCWFAVVEGWRQARPAKPKAPQRRER